MLAVGRGDRGRRQVALRSAPSQEVQVKSILHQMLLSHRWSVPSDYRMPGQQAPISKPLDGLPVNIESI